MTKTKSIVKITWLDECPKCGYGTAFVSGNGYRTTQSLWSGDSVVCADCGHEGEIEADGENAWVNWDEVEGGFPCASDLFY